MLIAQFYGQTEPGSNEKVFFAEDDNVHDSNMSVDSIWMKMTCSIY